MRKLLDILQARANSACKIEIHKIETEEKFENPQQAIQNLETCAELKITIIGNQNEELFGSINDVFNSTSFPESIVSIYLHSELQYTTRFKHYPENSFSLFIDFTKPKIFDFSFQPGERTPNNSRFEVQGSDNTWVNGVFHEIDFFLRNRPSKFPSIHKGSIYDIIVWFLGIPLGFWTCYKVLNYKIIFFSNHHFIESVFLTYCFLLTLFVLRILFHYFRWVYPMIEYRSKKNRSIAHQLALFSITLSLIGKFIYDMITLVFKN